MTHGLILQALGLKLPAMPAVVQLLPMAVVKAATLTTGPRHPVRIPCSAIEHLNKTTNSNII